MNDQAPPGASELLWSGRICSCKHCNEVPLPLERGTRHHLRATVNWVTSLRPRFRN